MAGASPGLETIGSWGLFYRSTLESQAGTYTRGWGEPQAGS